MARGSAAAQALPARPARAKPAPRRPARPSRAHGDDARRAHRRAGVATAVRRRGAGLLDSLLYGRGWIALVGVLLVGIVFFNVDLLQMNREITRTSARSVAMKRENARLRLELARFGSSERIQGLAAAQGLYLPAPDEVRYLRVNPRADARRAAKLVPRLPDAPEPGGVTAPLLPAPPPEVGG